MERINPAHAVNLAERMRNTAFNVHARRGRFKAYWQIVNASIEPHGDVGEWRKVEYPKGG